MRLVGSVLQAVGCVGVAVGAGLIGGIGVGVAVGGVLALLLGVVLEREGR